jgi:hypothetical protein
MRRGGVATTDPTIKESIKNLLGYYHGKIPDCKVLSCWGKEEKGHSAWPRHLEEYHSPDQKLATRLGPRSERGTSAVPRVNETLVKS